MQRTGFHPPRFFAISARIARGLCVATLCVSTLMAGPGWAQSTDTAMAVPRIATKGLTGIALPQPLSPSEAVRIRRIFVLIDQKDFGAAQAEQLRLTNTLLSGTLLAARLRAQAGAAQRDDLVDWLDHYADHPDAPRILALARGLPQHVSLPQVPEQIVLQPEDAHSDIVARPADNHPGLTNTVRNLARGGRVDRVRQYVARSGLPGPERAWLLGEAAQALFTSGQDVQALTLAREAIQLAPQAALPPYVAGLAAWRLHRLDEARRCFDSVLDATWSTPDLTAAGAFWAARAHVRHNDLALYVPLMNRAARYPASFYGQLARRAMGMGAGISGKSAVLGEADADAVAATSEGARAFALIQVGQTERAEAELRLLWPKLTGQAMRRSVLLVARAGGMKDLAVQLAARMSEGGGDELSEAALLDMPTLKPVGGFRLDPAMVYALARVESNFDPKAVSAAGARGLMQIMPSTAVDIVENTELTSAQAQRLHDPAMNLAFGQRYVQQLARSPVVHDDLIRLLASYNSGPGNFNRWGSTIRDDGDPLLFLESIPVDETRNFIARTLTYTWLYAARMRLPTPSLDQLAAGDWPSFGALSKVRMP